MQTFSRAALAAACLVLAWGAAPARADTQFEDTLYIGSADDYFRYTATIEDATGHFTIVGTLVYDGEEYGVVAESRVGRSGLKSPARKRFVASGTAAATGLGEVPVSNAYGATGEAAVRNFVNNVVAGVLIQRMQPAW
jgi:hypothetical protein